MRPGEEEIVELVNAAVDGVATPEQQAELERLLATSPDVRELYDETRNIARRLESMNVETPPDLRSWFVERRPSPAAAGAPRRAPFHGRRRIFAAAWAAAAVLVLVFVIIGRQQMTDTGATMAPAWPVIEQIATPEATLVVRRQGELVSLEVLTTRPESFEIEWDPSQLTFVGLLDEKDASLRKASVRFTLRDPSQRAGVIVRPRNGASVALVILTVENREVFRGVVALK